jgi:hypothetical protein
MDRFCSACGSPRADGARFCPSCGRPFDSVGPTVQAAGNAAVGLAPPAFVVRSTSSTAQYAGVAWLITAAITGYLAFEQWTLATALGVAASGRELMAVAALNGVSALITAYFGARCLQGPRKGQLGNAAVWGLLSVSFGVYQVAQGASYGVFLLSIVAAGVAGILSFVARDQASA